MDFDGFEPFMFNKDVAKIFDIVKKVHSANEKIVARNSSPKPVSTIDDILDKKSQDKKSQDKPSELTLKMILQEKIKPKLNSEIRFEALKEIKKKNLSRFKVTQTTPREFNFKLLVREKQKEKSKKHSPRESLDESLTRSQNNQASNLSAFRFMNTSQSIVEDNLEDNDTTTLPKIK